MAITDFNRRSVLVQNIVDLLILKEVRKQNEVLRDLIVRNQELGNPPYGFLFGGKFHTTLPGIQQAKVPKKPLHPELHGRALEYLDELKYIDVESRTIKQGLSLLVANCQTEQDIRDALPESIVQMVPRLQELPRTRPEAWTLEDKPLQKHQYGTIQVKIDYFLSYEIRA